ncbi:hypothetical protein KRX57_07415 [Weeksellaceae bacterium TAE3-ERU29]|nr:hypothetical protein [Weeksellaceae bacterium TAE3-ERU29]
MKKKILLLGVCICAYTVQGQVGINTMNPVETLDVNGTLRVADIPESSTGTKIVVIDENNKLNYRDVEVNHFANNHGFNNKKYLCDESHYEKKIYTTDGILRCARFGSPSRYVWFYTGSLLYYATNDSSEAQPSWTYSWPLGHFALGHTINEVQGSRPYQLSRSGEGVIGKWFLRPIVIIDDSEYID